MSRKLKVGILGLGRAGAGMHTGEIKANSDKIEIVAVCDIDAGRAKEVGEKLGVAYYTDINDFLKDKNMDMVSVATFSADHTAHSRLALEAGFYVFMEKPIATSQAQADEIAELNKKYPGKIYIRQNRRFEPTFQHVREIIASGILGKIHTIKLCRNSFSRRNDWQTLLSMDGGQLNNWGPHLIDHALQFLNYEVDSVWSELKLLAAQGDAEDSVKIIMRGKDGLTVDIEIYGGNAMADNIYGVYGSRGALQAPSSKELKLKYIDPDYELKPYPVNTGHPDGFKFADNAELPWKTETLEVAPALKVDLTSCYRYVAESIVDGKEYPVTVEQALEVVKICEIVKSQSPFYNK